MTKNSKGITNGFSFGLSQHPKLVGLSHTLYRYTQLISFPIPTYSTLQRFRKGHPDMKK